MQRLEGEPPKTRTTPKPEPYPYAGAAREIARAIAYRKARTAEAAVRRGAQLHKETVLTVASLVDVQGWQDVRMDGEASGRVRLHQRMMFRRNCVARM